MNTTEICKRQKGTALALSLLILLVLTIVGVASLSNTQMQERMSGNFNLQALAFEAASAGTSEALKFGVESLLTTAPRCDEIDFASNPNPTLPQAIGAEQSLRMLQTQGIGLFFQLRADCLEDSDPAFTDNPNKPTQAYVTSKGIVRRVTDGEPGDILAEREIELRLDSFRTDGRSAIRIEGEAQVEVLASNRSNSYQVDGLGGPAISTTPVSRDPNNADLIAAAIGDDRLANYDGGIVESTYGLPFSSAWHLARFALEIRAFMDFHDYAEASHVQATGTCNPIPDWQPRGAEEVGLFAEDVFGTNYVPEMRLINNSGSTYSPGNSETFNGITYVTGNLDMNGNQSGNGLLIVQGTVRWKGTAEFSGVVIVLGGEYETYGSGNGETYGTVFITNVDLSTPTLDNAYSALKSRWSENSYDNNPLSSTYGWPLILTDIHNADPLGWGNPSASPDDLTDLSNLGETIYEALYQDTTPDGFGVSTLNLNGGGNAVVRYDCKWIEDVETLLSACGQVDSGLPDNYKAYNGLADPMELPSPPWPDDSGWCVTPGQGARLQSVQSWRDNILWREALLAN